MGGLIFWSFLFIQGVVGLQLAPKSADAGHFVNENAFWALHEQNNSFEFVCGSSGMDDCWGDTSLDVFRDASTSRINSFLHHRTPSKPTLFDIVGLTVSEMDCCSHLAIASSKAWAGSHVLDLWCTCFGWRKWLGLLTFHGAFWNNTTVSSSLSQDCQFNSPFVVGSSNVVPFQNFSEYGICLSFAPQICVKELRYSSVDGCVSQHGHRQLFQSVFPCLSASFKLVMRWGEAEHPGPRITVGNINPTQLFGKEDLFPELANTFHSVWTFSETSHTTVSRQVSQHRFRQLGYQSAWSVDNPPLDSRSDFRGKAAGTCIISTLPLRHHVDGIAEDILQSRRYCEAVVQLTPHTSMLVIAFYGPTYGATYTKPEAILHALTAVAFERGQMFQGPVLITGDLNVDLDVIPHWSALENRGWKDMAQLSALKWGHPLQPTCRSARHSFLLGNPQLICGLHFCDTKETYDFHLHPTLYAEIDCQIVARTTLQWALPQSMDGFLFDPEYMEDHACQLLSTQKEAIHEALKRGDSEVACRVFVQTFEEVCKNSAVDVVGESVVIPQRCFGRSRPLPFVRKAPSAPCCKIGRPGSIQPAILQCSVELRRLLKQCRRLEALERLLNTQDRQPAISRALECQQLWDCCLSATGFHHGFAQWICTEFASFVPSECPHLEYIVALKQELLCRYKAKSQRFFLAKQRNRRNCVALDVASGGTRTFAELREPALPPPDHVAFQVTANIRHTRWTKNGLNTLCCIEAEHGLICGIPITFQGQHARIIDIQGAKIWLDKPVKLRNYSDFTISQIQRSSDPEVMHSKTREGWDTLWQRDAGAEIQEWDEGACFMTCLADCPSLPASEFNLDQWKQIIRRIPRRSARGACGFSKRDLQVMPVSLTCVLFTLFASFECGCPWPFRWAIARTTCLRKNESLPSSALDFRPITIMSRMYRCWSAYRSREVLAHIARMLPPQVSGNTGAISADLLSCETQLEIEHAQTANETRVGAVLDLKKCYDLIPRVPLILLLRIIGIPICYLQALASILAQCMRSFDILGTLGPLFATCTGIPQGCSLSVACMCALTLFAHKMVDPVEGVLPIFFADNWSLVAQSVPGLVSALSCLEKLAKALKMVFAPDKSWVWSSLSRDIRALKKVKLQGKFLPFRNQATDLGCDITYRGTHRKQTILHRCTKARNRLHTIGKKRLPFKFRRTAAKLAGHGAMMYGSEFTFLANSHWHRLRSATTEAMTIAKGGTSPWLALGTYDAGLDPQFRSIIQKLKFWRKFFRIFPQHKHFFLLQIAKQNSKQSSPSGCFWRSFRDVGWTCLDNGLLRHHMGILVNWMEDSFTFLQKVFSFVWPIKILENIQHRKGVDMTSFDPTAQRKLFQNRPPAHQGALITYSAGKHFTADLLAKFSDVEDICPFCKSQPDGRLHRIFDCTGLAELRKQYRGTVEWAKQQPSAVAYFCLCPIDLQFVVDRLCKHGNAFPLELPDPSGEIAIIFTDGSAILSERWETCFCAGAFLVVDAHLGWNMIQHNACILPGNDHSSFRGESFAILLALNHVFQVKIYSDCQEVIDRLLSMAIAHKHHQDMPLMSHSDIWGQIWQHFLHRPVGTITCEKVRAHQSPEQFPLDSFERWVTCWNNRVDCLAKEVLQQEKKTAIRRAQKWHSKCDVQSKHMQNLASFVVDIANQTFECRKKKPEPVTSVLTSFDALKPSGICNYLDCFLSAEDIQNCPFTPKLARAACEWASQLGWVTPPVEEPISLIELYVDFCLFSGLSSPIQIVDKIKRQKGHRPKYALRGDHLKADLATWELSLQSNTWARFFRWMANRVPALKRLKFAPSRSLRSFGYRLWHVSINIRPVLTHGTEPFEILHRYFCTSSGKRRNLTGAFHLVSLRSIIS